MVEVLPPVARGDIVQLSRTDYERARAKLAALEAENTRLRGDLDEAQQAAREHGSELAVRVEELRAVRAANTPLREERDRLLALVERRLRLTVPQAAALLACASSVLAGEEGQGDCAHVSFEVLHRAHDALVDVVNGAPPASDNGSLDRQPGKEDRRG